MKIGGKEMIAILAILVIVFMSFQGSRENKVIVLDRQPEYIRTPVFIGGEPRLPPRVFPDRRGHRGHRGHHRPHHGKPPKPPKPMIPVIPMPPRK
jgi:hypothetical protein